ncbi:hypothetical protein D1631_11585 [Chryseobacterium nematophagum]|uniref:Uncharacterized protein n=1 Tax=Chryseobacterium nematophagum TaxID=2305228 RepID=A0A3M7TIP3_9FLAO|nr:hypothetical protein [Chryseobacterium nematophagum]RNA62529.1 hypothetical protein D1631_11585 [Chryseobacterium nematophagum]
MRNIQLLGLLLVVIGSFLPLVHIPIIGNWNYWKLDHNLAIMCWFFSVGALFGIVNRNTTLSKIFAVLLIFLFLFTLVAIKVQSLQYFSFLPFQSWKETFVGIVKLKWGWAIEFLGAILIFFSPKKRKLKYHNRSFS